MCKTFGRLPNDPEIEEMDPVLKMYMFNHWLQDIEDQVELFKNHGYLIGSFTNPEAVRQMMQTNQISSSEEDFEIATQLVAESIKQSEPVEEVKPVKKRKRRRAISN